MNVLSSDSRSRTELCPPGPALGDKAGFQAADALAGQLVEEMADAWRHGDYRGAEQLLAAHPNLGRFPEAAVRLIYEEICLREEYGLDSATADLLSRFPQWRHELEVVLSCHRLLQPQTTVFPEPGQDFADLRLLLELGRGAQGRVFLAAQPLLANRAVVLKLTPCDHEEHWSLARLQHMHIVPLYWAQDLPERNLRALCMPYLGGATFSQVLKALDDRPLEKRTGKDLLEALDRLQQEALGGLRLPEPVEARLSADGPARRPAPVRSALVGLGYVEALCGIGACLADALHYAHERGLVHLDLKPSNVLLASDGQPMLLDFHLARKPLQPNGPAPEWFGGTPEYMSPEQRQAISAIRNRKPVPVQVDGRSDVYSLGVFLYRALGGTMPEGAGASSGSTTRLADRGGRQGDLPGRSP